MANWKVLTLTSVAIGLCGLVLIITLFTATGGYVPFDYGVVLDAGSSHTQITLYHWKADKERCTGVVEQLDTCRIEGGISGYNITDVSVVGEDLMQCVRNVSTKIDRERLMLTPLYLGATAGMRLLNITAPMIVNQMANWKVLTLTSVAIGLCGLVLIITLFTATGGYVPFDYGVVLDAGSSHTQITLYHWKANKERCTGVVEQLDTCRIEGGISGYNITDVSVVGEDLMQCVRNVSTKIDRERLMLTPLYLGATAGMRLLNITAPMKVKSIFDLIHKVFTLNTQLQIKTIDIISGQNEGLFSWVTNNYLMSKLVVDRFDTQSPNSTIGMLDMGGASAQIAFRGLDTSGNVTDRDDVNVRLYGINHTVHASSNLCFGVDQAMLRYQAYLILSRNRDRDP
ncbi:unnamed protein product, partial [Oppiella nova]